MKKTLKKGTALFLAIGICTTLLPIEASAQLAAPAAPVPHISGTTSQTITPFADIIGWRYKAVDGKMFRRQYNYSRSKWLGEWELC
ncbi:hypothetical protein [Gorillibacterium sp. CAU 1737]|uniref:hypothetical protein n=1 Tax=Gorillibacterium sp. CAU 1737 TaxID=3140362 RepID=UPI0032612AED